MICKSNKTYFLNISSLNAKECYNKKMPEIGCLQTSLSCILTQMKSCLINFNRCVNIQGAHPTNVRNRYCTFTNFSYRATIIAVF